MTESLELCEALARAKEEAAALAAPDPDLNQRIVELAGRLLALASDTAEAPPPKKKRFRLPLPAKQEAVRQGLVVPPAPPPALEREGVPHSDAPEVSVVIPAYGKAGYTLRCLASIARHAPKREIEVIVSEDASGDPDAARLRTVPGLRYLENAANLGFIRNCNLAAKAARGRYLALLNNDTEVTEGWLDALVEVFEQRPDAGLVGAKLLFADGRLQEAGVVVWRDATAWPDGRGDDPRLPQYNYLREVDYVSGAAMLIERETFERLGGFDELYFPAYYEDSDLAFRLRHRLGRRVYYQPRSVVIHHESVTMGDDAGPAEAAGGVRRVFLALNKRPFAARWREALEAEHLPYATSMFRARERAQLKRSVLVFGRTQAAPGAGWTTADFLRALADNDHAVKFWPLDGVFDPDVGPALQEAGVEWLCGEAYAGRATRRWLKEHGREFDAILAIDAKGRLPGGLRAIRIESAKTSLDAALAEARLCLSAT
jgi:GT2 family glycosyltransferase